MWVVVVCLRTAPACADDSSDDEIDREQEERERFLWELANISENEVDALEVRFVRLVCVATTQ